VAEREDARPVAHEAHEGDEAYDELAPESARGSEGAPPSAFRRRLAQLRIPAPWSNLLLFLATIASTFYVGASVNDASTSPLRGWTFAVPLLAILVTHEFGHWIQARRYGVDASLPYFIPLPLPPIGTMGAIISMRGRIRSRDALFDIGASGPLAGLAVAIPILMLGLRWSPVMPIPEHGTDEGQCLLYLLLKRVVLGPIPHGHDVFLHPTAFAGWVGLFMTMLNLIPVGQLDGGHVAYSLFGTRQDRASRWAHRSLLLVAVLDGLYMAGAALRAHKPWGEVFGALPTGLNWLVWFGVLWLLTRGPRAAHPPTDDDTLSPVRRVLAWGTLCLFVLLFMPFPLSQH
jgi:membrane-associated protease RseP (regulator of RpoE activity)